MAKQSTDQQPTDIERLARALLRRIGSGDVSAFRSAFKSVYCLARADTRGALERCFGYDPETETFTWDVRNSDCLRLSVGEAEVVERFEGNVPLLPESLYSTHIMTSPRITYHPPRGQYRIDDRDLEIFAERVTTDNTLSQIGARYNLDARQVHRIVRRVADRTGFRLPKRKPGRRPGVQYVIPPRRPR